MKKLFICVLSISLLLSCSFSIHSESDAIDDIDREALLASVFESDITVIRQALDLRIITSHDLTEFYLERIDKYNPTFNCFITLCDNALEEADKCDIEISSGVTNKPLLGIPVVVKDNIEYSGFPTTNGLKKGGTVSTQNAAVVQKLIDAGAVIIGKTNMSTNAEEARRTYSQAVGETYNAYNTKLASGGSSGGTAVSVSLNFAAAGLGTDTNSSLRLPAALNGCISLRPTQGLLDRDGIIILNSRRDTPGVISRSISDQAIMLDVLSGKSFYDNLDLNRISGIKIGILKELSYPTRLIGERTEADVDSEVSEAFENAVEELRSCGAEIVTVSMRNLFSLSSPCTEPREDADANKQKFYDEIQKLYADNDIDVLIFPTYLSKPQLTGLNSEGGLTIYSQPHINNCHLISPPLGMPEITVPIGTHSNGAGMGLEICALRGNDQLLLDIAASYTSKYNHRVIPSTAPNIYSDSTVTLSDIVDEYLKSIEKESAESDTMPLPETVKDTESDVDHGKKLTHYLPYIIPAIIIVPIAVITLYRRQKFKKRRRW